MVKLIVCGHGMHGKDTFCEILMNKLNLTFESSSAYCCKTFLFDMLAPKYGYTTFSECYEDRRNHRSEWYDAICEYNSKDKSRVGREILERYDIYCGIRNIEELDALKQYFGKSLLVIWVDRSKIVESESTDSMTITSKSANYILDNNGTLEDLEKNVDLMISEMNL